MCEARSLIQQVAYLGSGPWTGFPGTRPSLREDSGREQFQLLDLVLVSRSEFGIVHCQVFSFTFKIVFFCFAILQTGRGI